MINFNQNKLLLHVVNIIAASLHPSAHMMFSLPRNVPEQKLLRFCTTERSSELYSLKRNGSERNFESLLLFLFLVRNSEHFSLPQNGSERNSENFWFRGSAGIPSVLTICFVYSVVRGIVFCRKIPTPHATGIQFLRNKEWKIACSLLPQTSKN